MTHIEYDPQKSYTNSLEHGIDFEQAQVLWSDPDLIQVKAMTEDEPRYLVVGMIDGRHWTAVITYRSDVVRIISVRRSRQSEVNLYDQGG